MIAIHAYIFQVNFTQFIPHFHSQTRLEAGDFLDEVKLKIDKVNDTK